MQGAAEDEDSAAAGDPDRSSRSTAEDVPSRQPSSHLRTGLGSGLVRIPAVILHPEDHASDVHL